MWTIDLITEEPLGTYQKVIQTFLGGGGGISGFKFPAFITAISFITIILKKKVEKIKIEV